MVKPFLQKLHSKIKTVGWSNNSKILTNPSINGCFYVLNHKNLNVFYRLGLYVRSYFTLFAKLEIVCGENLFLDIFYLDIGSVEIELAKQYHVGENKKTHFFSPKITLVAKKTICVCAFYVLQF